MRFRSGVLAWGIRSVLLCLVLIGSSLAASGQASFPNCTWKCNAKNVGVELFWVETLPGTCSAGEPTEFDIYVKINNGSSSDLHAAMVLADVYVDGGYSGSLEVCLGDLPPGITQIWVDAVYVDCSTHFELRNVIISWEPKPSDCADTPNCSARSTQCWSTGRFVVETHFLLVDFETDIEVCVGGEIAFHDLTVGGATPYAYSWDFGDGETSDEAKPLHTYAESGTYVVTLEVTDKNGVRNEATREVVVRPLPEAEASNGGPYGPGETIELFADGGSDYLWEGPHGFRSEEANPTRPNATAEDGGEYTVYVKSSEGCVSEAFTVVEILANADPAAEDGHTSLDEDSEADLQLSASDPDGDDLVFALLAGPSHGSIESFDPATGTLTYVPDPDYFGEDSFTFEVCDPDGACDTATFVLLVTSVDDPPVARDDAVTVPEDGAVDVALVGIDPDGNDLEYAIHEGPSHGSIEDFDPTTGTLTYVPNPNYAGSDSFTFEVCDPDGACDNATVTIAVIPENDPPVAENQRRTAAEDTSTGFFSLAISDPDDAIADLECNCVSPPDHGTVERGPNHTVNYTPDPDYAGPDSFEYIVCDSHDECDTAVVEILVTNENDNPIVEADNVETLEDTPVDIEIAHDEPDGDDIVCLASQPSHGTLSESIAEVSGPYPTTSLLTYIPDRNYEGLDSFTIRCRDPYGGEDAVTVEITVLGVNDAPTAGDDRTSMSEDGEADLQLSASDPDGDDLVFALLAGPSHGSIESFDPATGTLTYVPDPDYFGEDSFTFEVCDPDGACDTATFVVDVRPVNDPPTAEDRSTSVPEDGEADLHLSASDPDGDDLVFALLAGPSHGSIESFDPATGTLTYVPDPDYFGEDSFTFEVCDPDGACDTATFVLLVTSVDDPPVARDDAVTVPEDGAVDVALVGIDPDGNDLEYAIHEGPSHGSIEDFDPTTGTLTYVPNPNYAGSDSFTFEVCDPDGACDNATVTIAVIPENDPPVAENQRRTAAEDTSTGFFSLAISDPDDAIADLECNCVSPPDHGTVERGPNHTVNYTPDPDYAGPDSFEYIVCDSHDECDTAVVEILVTNENDNPIVEADNVETLEDTPVDIEIAHDEPDGDDIVCLASQPSHGTLSESIAEVSGPYPTTSLLTYIPDRNYEGLDSFTIRCRDPYGGEDAVTVEITVLGVNDAPTAGDDRTSMSEDGEADLQLSASDPDGDDLVFALLAGPSHGSIESFDPATGTLTYVPDPDYFGEDSFTFEVCDPDGACDTATFVVDVRPVDDPPTALPLAVTAQEDLPQAIQLVGEDPDGDSLEFSLSGPPQHGDILSWDPDTGQVVYLADPGYSGPDSFFFEVCDGDGACALAVVSIDVEPINDPPNALPISQTVTAGTTSNLSLAASDPDGDRLRFEILDGPSFGEILNFDPDTGRMTYRAAADFAGPDEFTYRVCDNGGLCDESVVQIFAVLVGGGGGELGLALPRIVISEIAWSGTLASPDDEWIELLNLESAEVDLTGWTLRWRPANPRSVDDRIWSVVSLQGIVSAFSETEQWTLAEIPGTPTLYRLAWMDPGEAGYYLLERGDDGVVSAVANQIYASSGEGGRLRAFSDAGDVIELLDSNGRLADSANATPLHEPGWAAGNASEPRTMERLTAGATDTVDNWVSHSGVHTRATDRDGLPVFGTPGAQNSGGAFDPSSGLEPNAIQASLGDTVEFLVPGDRAASAVRFVLRHDGVALPFPAALAGVQMSDGTRIEWTPEPTAEGTYDLWIVTPDHGAYLARIAIVE